jgi:fructokinase
MDKNKLFGTIEGGGTKFICAVADEQNILLREVRIPTTVPVATLAACADFFLQAQHDLGGLSALGIACFGPLDPRPSSPTYGHILATPKPGWENADLVGFFRTALDADLPIGFDTDVNAAVLAESHWGAGQGISNLVYLTIGTGIGGGALVDGQLLHGYAHPEMGHMLLAQHPSDINFPGNCPFHGTCLEGLASGPAIEARWHQKAGSLPPDHPAWQLEAHYIALGCMNICLILAPERIILGGGVMNQSFLFPMIRSELTQLLGNYLRLPQIVEMESYVVPSGLSGIAGLYGGLALAHQALQNK